MTLVAATNRSTGGSPTGRAGYPVVWAAFDGGHGPGPVDGCSGCEDGARTWTKTEVWRFFAQFQGAPPSGPTSPPAPTGSRLRGEASGRCLDISGANSANGTPAQIWDCHANANQQFSQNGAALQVMGKCLDAPANTGARVQIWDCNGGANQRWTFQTDGTIRGAQSGLCVDVDRNLTANGTVVLLWHCTGAANQRWTRR